MSNERLSEEQVSRALWRCFRALDARREREQDAEAWHVQPGSALAGDDRRTAPHQLSHGARSAMVASTDHQHAVRTLIVEASTLHMNAPFTLLRAAIETASLAVWLLAPANRSERVVRRLRLMAADYSDKASLTTAAGLTLNRPLADDLDRLCDLADAVQRKRDEVMKRPTSTAVVQAAELASGSRMHVFAAWKIYSGIAHGRTFANLALLDREIRAISDDGGVLDVSLESSLQTVLWGMTAARDVAEAAVRLYDQRSHSYL